MSNAIEIDWQTVSHAFGEAYFNLLRRGADGSLILSTDHWRLEHTGPDSLQFAAREADAPPLHVRASEVTRIVWDRLPKQTTRSQIRFYLASGDVWTFSGNVDESALQPGDAQATGT